MNRIKNKILYTFYGLESKLIDLEKNYNSKSITLFVLFPVIFVVGFYTLVFLSAREVINNTHWSLCALFSILPFYAFYSLISFSYISWKYGKERGDKISNTITMLLRSFIQIFVMFFIASLIVVQVNTSLGLDEIKQRKIALMNSFNNNEKKKNEEILRPINESLNEIEISLKKNNKDASNSGLREVEKQYYQNNNKRLVKQRDSISNALKNTTTKLQKTSSIRIQEFDQKLNSDSFYFIRLKKSLSNAGFYFISLLLTILIILFNKAYYKRFLSIDADYYNLDILLQKKLLLQEGKPVIDHTITYLKEQFNYEYTPPLTKAQIEKLTKKKRSFKDRAALIEELKDGSKN